MQFEYAPRLAPDAQVRDPVTFQVVRLSRRANGTATDISHLIDRSYDYHSPRELKWHLAERFGLPVQAVTLRQAA